MEAIYFGDNTYWGSGAGSGPWVMADLENGLFSGESPSKNTQDPTVTTRLVTAVVKGEAGHWAIRGGNAQYGSLGTWYDGPRPDVDGYNPMSKEGAIILGIGGDNSNSAQGTFYEGVMTSGYPSDDTENAVQANILAAGYAIASKNSGPEVTVGDAVSFHVTTPGYTGRYIQHVSGANSVVTTVLDSSSSAAARAAASFYVREGLGNSECYSFEAKDVSGSYLRHYNFQLQLNADDGTKQMHEDATFCLQSGLSGEADSSSIRSWSFPARYFRHYDNVLYIGQDNGPRQPEDAPSSYNNDVTFLIQSALG